MTDEATIRRALDAADLNVLRVVLHQLTGDPDLAGMKIDKLPIRGGAFYASKLAPEHADEVRAKAFSLLRQGPLAAPAPPSEAEVRRLMALLTGDPVSDEEFDFGFEELGFQEFPRSVEWSRRPEEAKLAELRVLIIGAGIGGIAAAVQLQRLGVPYTVIERQSGIGGTWLLNTYPEARVDTSSYFYQFRFEKNYPWTEYYASQQETRRYLEFIAEKYAVRPNMVFDREVVQARWDEPSAQWHVQIRTPEGQLEPVRCNVIISASGLFSTPKMPAIKGVDRFAGDICHTAAWDHSFQVTGKRVALIGNGSTGSQIMPYLAEQAEQLTVFQRTPNWIAPIGGYRDAVSAEVHWLFENVPYYWNWYCYSLFVSSCGLQSGQSYDPEWQREGGLISEANDTLRRSVTEYIRSKVGDDPELFAKCVPSYAPLGRRLVVDNGWYDALRRPNVELVTDGIEQFTSDAIETTDGATRPFDLVVLAAGFDAERYFWPVQYEGRDGATLEELWTQDGPRSYLGLSMPGFPNLFTIFGPNASPRAGSFYTWAELWARYVAKAIVGLVESGSSSMEVRREVFDSYNARLDEALDELIWKNETAGSYYVNEFGRVSGRMPWLGHDYYQWIREPDPDDYDIK